MLKIQGRLTRFFLPACMTCHSTVGLPLVGIVRVQRPIGHIHTGNVGRSLAAHTALPRVTIGNLDPVR